MKKTIFAVAGAVLILMGCAVVDKVPLGTPRDAVINTYGTPTQTISLPNGGTRLEYAFQPQGRKVVMVDLDATGRVASVRQVLTEAGFSRIEVGKWTRADVEREFGRPSLITHVGNWQGDIMTYRWRDTVGTDMFYWVYLDGNNIAQRVGQGMEFRDNFMRSDR
ncbi:MAG: hypothetical protein ABIO88_11540 [Burkholderiaceae bacterium]